MRFGLTETFWQLVTSRFGYASNTPSIYEFVLALFQTNTPFLPTLLKPDARVLMNRWRVNLRYQDSFRQLSKRAGNDLNLPTLLPRTTLEALLDDNLFEPVEQRIIDELARTVVSGTATPERIETIQKQRQNKYWYLTYQSYYDVLIHAVWIRSLVEAWADEPFEALSEGPERYTERLYRVDNHYRKLVYAYRQTKQAEGQSDLLETVVQAIDAVYTNQWLLPLSNHWQRIVDQTIEWAFGPLQTQRYFFRYQIEPQLNKGRTFVIISDGLRYEWGRELAERMQTENRYVADLSYMVTGLPSYTQLGMAALLPQTQLAIQPGTDAVLADSLPTQGTGNRSAILQKHKGIAISSTDFLALNANREGREWVKPYSVIYIYHNSIDRIGDTLATEQQVVDESDRVLDTIQTIIRKVVNMNGVHIWITADHGFLYQQQPVDDTDFLATSITGQVWKQGRRYIIGQNLKASEGFKRFESN
ncbi:BREX-1 system phosphatase PglZ type A [Spirosoma endophyticum]|uniref:BREX-1 system phosphatase PglZ type A n=1 Tax=Spirosoma endophyticum TaxID=662367 RepID=UPI000B85DF63|nr:BREX-1 system phosphatase PglZ type A [Spirosoma endophyticum]